MIYKTVIFERVTLMTVIGANLDTVSIPQNVLEKYC